MKIFHELPLGLMQYGNEWTDGDYCLPHLIDKYDQYRSYFERARLFKRFIICDNGLFEGITHTTEDLLDKINLIRPNIFIVPDAWNDATTTLVNAKSWMLNYKQHLPEGIELMAVLQGNTIGELLSTYQTLVDMGYKHIAFNHSSIAYQTHFPQFEALKSQMYGRIELVRQLILTDTVRKDIYHHLLGCSLPQEFMAYSELEWIKSVDTSNPILVGADGNRYTDQGLTYKPTQKLEHYFEKDLSGQVEDIIFNVNKFKSYVK
jgi:hypothetical protein